MSLHSHHTLTPELDEDNQPANLQVFDYEPALSDNETAIVEWLTGNSLTPPARLLYDTRGAALFETICATPEYYLTQKEEEILPQLARYLANTAPANSQIVEYGSGNRRKIAQLLKSCPQIRAHVPIDISKSHLMENARLLAGDFPDRIFSAICADFFQSIDIPSAPLGHAVSQNIGFFPGSTIGNMPPDKASTLLSGARRALGSSSVFVLAVDRVKPTEVLVDAYLDSAGASANFSLNLIDRINREMAGKIDKNAIRYDAVFNEETQAIEMWWIVERAHVTSVAGHSISLEKGQRFLVEISRKFTPSSVEKLAKSAGYELQALISTDDDWYSLAILKG
ncbi:MAG: L-histidine N(alpha)-methyltransferase [Pseudomonadota bacterium]